MKKIMSGKLSTAGPDSPSELWASNSQDWTIQEATFVPLYEKILETLQPKENHSLLDIGCGTGLFLLMASKNHCSITGTDISSTALALAKNRISDATFIQNEMEHLPFEDNYFDKAICNNSLQYSNDINSTLKEIYRVLQPDGQLIISLWADAKQCDSFAYFKVFYKLTNNRQEFPVPFNLSVDGKIETLLMQAGFKTAAKIKVSCPRHYPDLQTALKGILSSGPARQAIQHASQQEVAGEVTKAIEPFKQKEGNYKMNNVFFLVDSKK